MAHHIAHVGYHHPPLPSQSLVRKTLNPIQAVGALCHIVFFVASIVTLAVLAQRSAAEYVFHTLTNNVSGWTNLAVAWGIGLLTVTYPLTGFDGVLHISDEVKKARVQVPRSMITSVILNAIMQFFYTITILFTIGDIAIVSADPLPIIQVYYQATNSRSATNLFVTMLAIIFIIAFFNVFASVSRLLWAFARDNGLPFSQVFARVHPTLKLPINSLMLLGACQCLLRRLSTSHSTPIPWGPIKLGWAEPIVNLGAMCYIIFVLIWMPFLAFIPVDSVNMNYAGPIVGAVILGAVLDWCISWRNRFQVPAASYGPEFGLL
ncbi:hypothetical protein EJ07DRAFT_168683 [Lizonia empirigonia]|nr:hypothetical protein EJ07DRAFT_168683 [Lizonia empirigonia]